MKNRRRRQLSARGRDGRPTRRVLLLLDWYATDLHRGIARYAHEAGWALDATAGHLERQPLLWRPDGIICLPTRNSPSAASARRAAIPTVSIGGYPIRGTPQVTADNNLIGEMAADYFQRRGFIHSAFYHRIPGRNPEQRKAAFQRATARHGLNCYAIDAAAARRDARPMPQRGTGGPLRSRQGRKIEFSSFEYLRKRLVELPKPLAVFANFDDEAVEVITAAQAEGLRVPEEVAVLGVGNDELRCEFAPMRLSSIDDNLTGSGYTAAKLLDLLMRKKRPANRCIYIPPVGVITRESTDIMTLPHPHVQAALAAIQARFRESINAPELVKTIPLSYRRLHDAFKKLVGHSITDEVNRLRLEHAMRLLVDTDDKLLAIAHASGFSDDVVMSKLFRREKGMPPGAFRHLARERRPF